MYIVPTSAKRPWSVTALRSNLAAALDATAEGPQFVETDGRLRAVLVSALEWRELSERVQKKRAIQAMWNALDRLRVASTDDTASEDLPRINWLDPFAHNR